MFSLLKRRFLLLATVLLFFASWQTIATGESIAAAQTQSDLLQQLVIKQGKGEFVQQKYFSFLKNPIKSSGHFIVSEQAVLWQTKSPVFSEMLVSPQGIYQRLSAQENYQTLTENSQFSTLLTTIFTGRIKPNNWQISLNNKDDVQSSTNKNNCLLLVPKSPQLKTLFQQITLCSLEPFKRQINLLDQQGNKTIITLTVINVQLSSDELKQLNGVSVDNYRTSNVN